MRRSKQKQAGFTLVEIAVVLVIIGLIVAGVLTAQQVTQNAKITNTVQSIKSYQAAVQSYNQNYGTLPGDDVRASSRFTGSAPNGNGNGEIDGSAFSNTATEESMFLWQHLRAATLIKGAATGDNAATMPNHPFGGFFGIQHGAFTDSTNNGLNFTGNVLCLNQIPGAVAAAIDQQLDDGSPTTGTIKAGEKITSGLATTYNTNSTYVMCTPL